MFPRLHVNDTEKGGPRAPPRNKMALYEQLSIPSQRFNPGVFPIQSSNSSNFGSHGSSNQGSSIERHMLFNHGSPTTPLEKRHARQLEGASKNSPGAQLEQRRKPREEDDFSVPVFNAEGKHALLSRTYSGRLVKVQNVTNRDLNRSSSSVIDLEKEVRELERSKVCSSREDQMKSSSNSSVKRKFDEAVKESRPSLAEDYREQSASRFSRMNSGDDCFRGCDDRVESVRDSDTRDLPEPRNGSELREDRSSPDEPNSDSECHVVEIRGSVEIINGDKSDDASETSMVDSLSGSDLSPDDVVGVIGQKQFWKARRAIVNQQRMFAVQVFELHRLIKVQRLIAGSPHLLLEEGAYLGKPSTVKKLTSEFAIKPVVQIKCKEDDSGKPSHKLERSAENAVGRTSVTISSVKNATQPGNYGSYLGNLPPAPAPAPMDGKANPWFYHQSPGNQWLVPVMTPSEGLVYKPYPGPGFTGTAFGGCGPLTGNFMTPSPHHQGMGFYFPPYGMNPGMSGSAVENMNQFPQPGSQAQQQSSSNFPSGGNSRVVKSRVAEVQGSSASSPDERGEPDCAAKERTERNALPLFPMAPGAEEEASEANETELPRRVIRVVPRNPRLATESAVRIFQSIQEERKQNDAV